MKLKKLTPLFTYPVLGALLLFLEYYLKPEIFVLRPITVSVAVLYTIWFITSYFTTKKENSLVLYATVGSVVIAFLHPVETTTQAQAVWLIIAILYGTLSGVITGWISKSK